MPFVGDLWFSFISRGGWSSQDQAQCLWEGFVSFSFELLIGADYVLPTQPTFRPRTEPDIADGLNVPKLA
jgi:hypothetical protein